MENSIVQTSLNFDDERFQKALTLFNSGDWYSAHDVFEELWFETYGLERNVIQGILQIAVAQIHLESGNKNGATILFGEALGRLKQIGVSSLEIDLEMLCKCVNQRLTLLQRGAKLDHISAPHLCKSNMGAT